MMHFRTFPFVKRMQQSAQEGWEANTKLRLRLPGRPVGDLTATPPKKTEAGDRAELCALDFGYEPGQHAVNN